LSNSNDILRYTYFILVTETSLQNSSSGDPARNAYKIRAHIEGFQAAFTAIEKCTKPVIAAIHNACFGAGVDLVTACDIRYCTKDSFFCVKEVDVGLAADVGSLQRLPKVIGNHSLVRELCFTGRK
jgi:delta(3,5)-delta(2,4)-dienoyl-CoA isomerase